MSNKPCTKCRQPRYLNYSMCIEHMREKWRDIKHGTYPLRKPNKQRARVYNTGGPHFGDPFMEYLREVSS